MRAERYLEAALSGAVDDVASAGAGGRNAALNRAAFGLGGLLHAGLSADVAEAALVSAALAAGLSHAEAVATCRGALQRGAENPRELPAELGRPRAGFHRRLAPRPARPARPAPVELDPPEDAQGVLVELWEAIRGDALPSEAVAYLEGRALSARVAHDAGCRMPSREVLAEVWRSKGWEAFEAAGLVRRPKDGGRLVPAWKMHANEAARLWVPIWSPVWTDAPVAYRWRAVWPGAKVKACGPATAAHAWRDWPLGVHWPCSLWWGDRSAPKPVVVCEGEPDWLCLSAALEPGATVLGMPGTSGWREHWWTLLESAPALIGALHDDEAGRKATRTIGAALARAVPDETQRPPRELRAPPAGGDWNDGTQREGASALAPLVALVSDALARTAEEGRGVEDEL